MWAAKMYNVPRTLTKYNFVIKKDYEVKLNFDYQYGMLLRSDSWCIHVKRDGWMVVMVMV